MRQERSDPEPMHVVSVVLNWNGGETVLRCLEALRREAPALHGLIVVDNGSQDRSPERIATRFPDVELLQNSSNLGYAEGNNRGIRRALERGADGVLLLNNDVFVTPNFLEPLERALRSSSGVGIAGPKMKDAAHPEVIWCAGGDVTFGRNVSRLRGHRMRDDGRFDQDCDVDYIPGATLLVARQVFERVGFFDPLYFCYMEDVDFCVRVKRAGFRIRYVADAVVLHQASLSTGGGYTAYRKYMNAVNSVHFMRRHGSPARWLHFLLADVATLPMALVSGMLRGRGGAALAKGRGLIDGFRGVRISASVVADLASKWGER
ncbi:MAG: glycosyltransferase family 2 protein [Planctomycetota bacterium]